MAKYFCLALNRKPVIYFKLIDQAHCNIGHRYHVSVDLAIPKQTIPYGIVLYRIISYHTISYRITSHHISYHIVSYHTILYHIWYIVSYTVLYGIIYYIIYIVSYIILYGITHRIILHNAMSHDITYHVACSVVNHISYHTISHHIILSYHITYHIIYIYLDDEISNPNTTRLNNHMRHLNTQGSLFAPPLAVASEIVHQDAFWVWSVRGRRYVTSAKWWLKRHTFIVRTCSENCVFDSYIYTRYT